MRHQGLVRRSHTKSTKGCLQCKKRHVKCNEAQPQCARCQRLELECCWPEKRKYKALDDDEIMQQQYSSRQHTLEPPPLPRAATRSVSISEQSPASNNSHPSNGSDPPPPHNLDVEDMKLLHYWYLNTSLTCSNPGETYIWQTSVVELGFRHHFLLRGVLAVAAVHKATQYPEEADKLLLRAAHHMDPALDAFRSHIARPDPATCVPMYALASLLVMHRIGVAQLQPPTDPLGELCVLARLSRGVRPLLMTYWSRIELSDLGPLIRAVRDANLRPAGHPIPPVLTLRAFVATSSHLTTSLREDCLLAVDGLHERFSHLPFEADQAAIGCVFSWTAILSVEFVDALSIQKEPVCLLVAAYFAALIRYGEKMWCFRGWSRWVLKAVEEDLERVGGGAYEEWLVWPRGEILKDD